MSDEDTSAILEPLSPIKATNDGIVGLAELEEEERDRSRLRGHRSSTSSLPVTPSTAFGTTRGRGTFARSNANFGSAMRLVASGLPEGQEYSDPVIGSDDALVWHENDALEQVVMCRVGESLSVGLLHPAGSLLEDVAFGKRPGQNYSPIEVILRENGVRVSYIKDMVVQDCVPGSIERANLERLAAHSLQYEIEEESQSSLLLKEEKYLISDQYKREVIQALSTEQLYDIVISKPTVTLCKSAINNPLATVSVTYRELTNMMFMRDQSITTPKGIILGRMSSIQRGPEVDFVEYLLEKVGWKAIARVPDPGVLEGADYIPFGPNLCFLGVGSRTNYNAVNWLMDQNLLGTQRVAVVRDIFDRSPKRLWLEKVLAVLGPDVVAVATGVLGADSPVRRLVDEYIWNEKEQSYDQVLRGMELVAYLEYVGVTIVPVVTSDNEFDCSTFFSIGGGKVVTSSVRAMKLLQDSPHFKGEVVVCGDVIKYRDSVHSMIMVAGRRRDESNSFKPRERPLEVKVKTLLPAMLPRDIARNRAMVHTTNCVIGVAPTSFYSNKEAAEDNFYMSGDVKLTKQRIQRLALREYSQLHLRLQRAGVSMLLFTHQPYHDTPDAVFPNNWFSTHSAAEVGKRTLILYPMKVANRRRERRPSIYRLVNRNSDYQVVSYADNEMFGRYFEGTGVLSLDRYNKVAYMALSERAHPHVATMWAKDFGYELVMFHSTDEHERPIYHTNVMMYVATTVAVVCLASIVDPTEREHVVSKLTSTGHEIVNISHDQVRHLCGNVIEVRGHKNMADVSFIAQVDSDSEDTVADVAAVATDQTTSPINVNDPDPSHYRSIMVMSDQAYYAFTFEQRRTILKHVDVIVHVPFSTIETIGGGGVRCSIAELF